MLSVTSEEIEQLSDGDLEELIALLCDAELSKYNISNAGVTRGGALDEADGGIDIKVHVDDLPRGDGYIPRAVTGFQVKKPDMPRGKILKEMRPKGALRWAITQLAKTNGAYIIVSIGRSLTEPLLESRLEAMKEALDGLDCHINFYGSTRVTTWTNTFPGLVYWVKKKLSAPLNGWEGYGNWTTSNSQNDLDYVLDDNTVLKKPYNTGQSHTSQNQDSYNTEDAINHIRSILETARASVRLVGLSGVGKTRFVQALFEETIGKKALPFHMALYTDLGEQTPSPSPFDLIRHLELRGDKAIVILDNCSAETHTQITQKLIRSNSSVSLVTIEYDVREDLPVDTTAFRLEPSSDNSIEKVLKRRFPKLLNNSIKRLTKLAGGNYRVAIALAQHIQEYEDISKITDSVLFKRLFWQKNIQDEDLLKTAEVLSLVYSFDFSDSVPTSEIGQLGEIVGLSGQDVYRRVAELRRRNLVQARSNWRAILPHALANRLAEDCLENTPTKRIKTVVEATNNFRVLKSMSRRLAYIKEHPKAKEITSDWLSKDGIVGNPALYEKNHLEILKNLAVIRPHEVLLFLQSSLEKWQGISIGYVVLLQEIRNILTYIAYQPELFQNCIELMVKYYFLNNSVNDKNNNWHRCITIFFQSAISGTHAPVTIRIKTLESIWGNYSTRSIELVFSCLNAGLKTSHMNGHPVYDYDFTRKDYGYQPKNWDECREWYRSFIELLLSFCIKIPNERSVLLKILAANFRGMWSYVGLQKMLVEYTHKILSTGVWLSGWIAISQALNYDRGKMDFNMISQLEGLLDAAKPTKVTYLIDAYVLMKGGRVYEPIDGISRTDSKDRWKEYSEIVFQLGSKVSNDTILLENIIPKVITSDHTSGLSMFGYGVGKTCENPIYVRNLIRDKVLESGSEERSISFFKGFIEGVKDQKPELAEVLLDDLIIDDVLALNYPVIQIIIGLNKKGCGRMIRSLSTPSIPALEYTQLGFTKNKITDKFLDQILKGLSHKSDGLITCLEIIGGRIDKEQQLDDILHTTILSIVSRYQFDNSTATSQNYRPLFDLANIIRVYFNSPYAHKYADILAINIKNALITDWSFLSNHASVVYALVETNPLSILNSLVDIDDTELSNLRIWSRTDPLNRMISSIDNDILLTWCQDTPRRNIKLAGFITPFSFKGEELDLQKWSRIVECLSETNDQAKVLEQLELPFSITSWSGKIIPLLQKLDHFLDDFISLTSKDELKVWAHSLRQRIITPQIERAGRFDVDWDDPITPQSFE